MNPIEWTLDRAVRRIIIPVICGIGALFGALAAMFHEGKPIDTRSDIRADAEREMAKQRARMALRRLNS